MFAFFDASQGLTYGLFGVIALVAVAVAVFLGIGLFQARSLVRREFSAYFLSPVAYVVLVVFLFATGISFAQTFGLLTTTGPYGTRWPMQTLLANKWLWLVLAVIPPLLTMRLFAEERSSGTLEMLMTAPLRDWQVVLAKYVACLGFYVVLWLPTLLYIPVLIGVRTPTYDLANWTVYRVLFLAGLAVLAVGGLLLLPRLGTGGRILSLALVGGGALAALAGGWLHYQNDPVHIVDFPITLDDPGPVLTTYLGMFLAGAMFLAMGLLVSSLVRDQMVAAIIAIALSLIFIGAVFLPPVQDGSGFVQVVNFFNVPRHFEHDFTRGVLDSRALVLYGSVTLFCLFLTVRSLESRRWRA
jgi:ABC-type transport system involved in multi-copper enzyme maturation permease subunit